MAGRATAGLGLAAALLLTAPCPGRAEVVVDVFTGTSRTRSADVRFHQPRAGNDLRVHRLRFDDASFEAPPYYGLRATYFLAGWPRVGLAVDFLHFKLLARTDDVRRVTGLRAGVPIDARLPVSAIVQRFDVSHGVNYVTLAGLVRYPLLAHAGQFPHGRIQVYGGAGVGPVITHTEVAIDGVRSSEGYELAGLGVQGVLGVRALLTPWFGLFAEYRLTRAELDVGLGTGRARLDELSHHAVGGITLSLPWSPGAAPPR